MGVRVYKSVLVAVLLAWVWTAPFCKAKGGDIRVLNVELTVGSNDLMFSDHYLAETTVRNHMACAAFCNENEDCLSYDVSAQDSNGRAQCILRDMLVLDPKWLITAAGFTNYHKPVPMVTFLGCYTDQSFDRAMDELVTRAPFLQYYQQNSDFVATVKVCAVAVQNRGYDLVGIEYYGECFGGYEATRDYGKHGELTPSSGCYYPDSWVGKAGTLAVYRIQTW